MGVKCAFMLYLHVCWKLFICSDKYVAIRLKMRPENFCIVLHCSPILTIVEMYR
jgi:hypothetical protein